MRGGGFEVFLRRLPVFHTESRQPRHPRSKGIARLTAFQRVLYRFPSLFILPVNEISERQRGFGIVPVLLRQVFLHMLFVQVQLCRQSLAAADGGRKILQRFADFRPMRFGNVRRAAEKHQINRIGDAHGRANTRNRK